MNAGAGSDRLLSAKEAADYLGISVKRLYAFCKEGSLRHLRLTETESGVLRFRKAWLDDWAETRASGGCQPATEASQMAARDLKARFWICDYYPGDHNPLATAETIEAALDAVREDRTPHTFRTWNGVYPDKVLLQIIDHGGGAGPIWSGTSVAAGDPRLLATCESCGHLGIDHWTPMNESRFGPCRHARGKCGCKDFTA